MRNDAVFPGGISRGATSFADIPEAGMVSRSSSKRGASLLLVVVAQSVTVGCATETAPASDAAVDGTDMFTDVDLEQNPDTSDATTIALRSGEDVQITTAGVYLLSGDVEDVTIRVEADDAAEVQLVLDGVSVTNVDTPAVYVVSADKVIVTTTDSDNALGVTGTFVADGDTNIDAVIFSSDDLVMNGVGRLDIDSSANGISSKDALKVTGGTWTIVSALDGLEAHDSIRIGGGDITIDSGADAVHAEYDEDDTVGFVYVSGGTLRAIAVEDGIRGTPLVQIDGGTVEIDSAEGIEATFIQLNAGTVTVTASDDGINAAAKTAGSSVAIEVNGGTIAVTVGSGDTDAFDANGDIFVNGGSIDIVTPRSAFDADGVAELNGGTVTVNGEVITEITQQGPGGGR